MTKFQEEMVILAEEEKKKGYPKREARSSQAKDAGTSYKIEKAMDELVKLAETGANIFNEVSGGKELSVYRLPEELLAVFLSLPGGRMGFCIASHGKFAIFLDEQPDQIVVLGKKRQNERSENAVIGARQLIKVTCVTSEDRLIFKDNTGADLDIEDTVKHIIKWLVSE